MTPTADNDSPHPRWGESSASGDPGTDPGRPHPYESLYRGGAPGSRGDGRPTPRHYIPSISRPDGVESGYGWLYRDPEPEVPASPGVPGQPPLPPELAFASEPEAPVRRSRRALRIIALIVLLALLVSGAAGLLIRGVF